MTREEYAKDFCSRCKKCDGSGYHRYHCTDNDILEEAWDACLESVCEWLLENATIKYMVDTTFKLQDKGGDYYYDYEALVNDLKQTNG